MNIGIKVILFWIASLALFVGAGIVFRLYPQWLSGMPGLFVCFFLSYCAIIIVAQAFAVIEILRRVRKSRLEESRRYQTETESA